MKDFFLQDLKRLNWGLEAIAYAIKVFVGSFCQYRLMYYANFYVETKAESLYLIDVRF
jgi:hypothetical protein